MSFRDTYLHYLSHNAWNDPLIATAAMSQDRASSAVRNLRSIFENKASLDSSSPDSRGRSPSGVGGSDKENGYRPRSKVRASFVPVELAGGMAAVDSNQGGAGMRRGSFSEADGDGVLSDLKRTVSEQQNQRLVPEGAVESAVATPNRKPGEGRLGYDMPADNPDKAVTGGQDSSEMKTGDPASEDAVSGGDALPPVAEDLRSAKSAGKKTESKKPAANGKPSAISTKAPLKASSNSVKSPASQPKTPTSAKVSGSSTNAASTASPSLKAPLKKPSRSSLTAPTAASLARSGAGSDKSSSTKTSPTANPKPREVTKPVNLPSHLTAPTAASRAKHEPESVPAPSTFRATTASRPKPTTPAKVAPRASIGPQPVSRDSNSTSRKSTVAPDSSFLERMTKPTAASVNRTAEKPEVKSPPPPKAKPAATTTKPKLNGAKSAPKTSSTQPSAPVDEAEDPIEATPILDAAPAALAAATDGVEEEPTYAEAVKEDATPNGEEAPAAIGGEEAIRGPVMLWGILQA